MAGELATAYVQIVPSARGMTAGITKELGGAGDHAGTSFGKNLVGKIKGIIAAAGIGKALSASLMEGAALQQNLGGVEAVFGAHASAVKNAAVDAYKTMGLSQSDYMATANKMGSLFQGSGLEQQRALELTTSAMLRAADVASVMGIDTSVAMESIAGAAKGNFTMMDNLGVAMNATTLEAYALEKGVNFKWNTASNAEKAELAMEMFFDRTAQYAGNFERESQETFTGAFEAMKASAKNVLGNLMLGEDIKPSLNTLVETAKTFLAGNLLPAVKNIVFAIPGVIGELGGTLADAILGVFGTDLQTVTAELESIFAPVKEAIRGLFDTVSETAGPVIQPVLDFFSQYISSGQAMTDAAEGIKTALEGLSDILTTIIDGISQFVTWLTSGSTSAQVFLGVLSGIAAAVAAFSAISTVISTFKNLMSAVSTVKTVVSGFFAVLTANPFALIVAAIAGVVAAVIYLWNNCESFRSGVTAIWEGIKSSIISAVNGAKEGFEQFKAGLQAMKEGAAQILDSVKSKFSEAFDNAKETVKNAIDKIKGFFDFEWSLPSLKLPHFSISGAFSLDPPSVPRMRVDWYKSGGILKGAQIFGTMGGRLLGGGEAGAEAVLPLSEFYRELDRILTRNAPMAASSSAGGDPIVINVYGTGSMDEEALAQRVMEKLQFYVSRREVNFA